MSNRLIHTLAHIAYATMEEMFVTADEAAERAIALKKYGEAYEASIRRNALADAALSVKVAILRELTPQSCPHGKQFHEECEKCEADDEEPFVQGPDTQL